MKRFHVSFLVFAGVLLMAPLAFGQALEFGSAHYAITADAYAGVNGDVDTLAGSSAATFGLVSVSATADDSDPILGGASASASSIGSWLYTGGVGSQSLITSASGSAYAGDFGLSASSNAYSDFDVRFTVTYDTTGAITFGSMSPFGVTSKVERFDGVSWIMVADSSVANWSGDLEAGDYRWTVVDAIGVSGNWSDGYGHDMELIVNDPVPEPASLAALGLGALALLRRRKK